MKKILTLILVLVMVLSITACDNKNGDNNADNKQAGTTTEGAGNNQTDSKGGQQGTHGGQQGTHGGQQGNNSAWFTADALSALGIEGLQAPNGTYTVYFYEQAKNGGVTFTNGTVDLFNDYAAVLYNYGFNQKYDGDRNTYSPIAITEALTGDDTYRVFGACKYIEGVCRVEAIGQHTMTETYKDTSISFYYTDLTKRPENTWFTSSEANEMGLTGLDTFANIADKTVVSSRVLVADPIREYKISVSGVSKEDAMALAEYFFGKGANIDHNEENESNPSRKSSYNDDALLDNYTDSFTFWANFCMKSCECDVYLDWCKDPVDAGGNALPENLLSIDLTWNKGHKVGNH